MEIIDNVNRLLGDDLKATIEPGARLRIAASTFSIYAFEALRKELEGIDSLDFLFTAPTFVPQEATDKVRRARREYVIPHVRRESTLYGSEFEIRLRNRLTQRAAARECADRLQFTNLGGFVDGSPEEYVTTDRVAHHYRNPFLVRAMAELRMIDRLGYGIRQLNRSQARRFLPLPDYDLSRPGEVTLTLYGAVIDQNYSEQLMARTDLPLHDVLALDRVQKGLPLPDETVDRLRRASLVEGRRPHLRVAATIADATDTRATYIRTRALDDRYYEQLVIDLLREFGSATRAEIDQLLLDKLSDALTDVQRATKVSNLLAKMRRDGRIYNEGTRQQSRWVLL